ncbi:MAG: sugar phosphate isomerase/epimerase family protein [Bryobacteraceae bacterium]
MNHSTRRQFAFAAAAAAAAASSLHGAARKFTMHLTCGTIGVKATQLEAIEHAHRHGWEAVEPNAGYLGSLSDSDLRRLLDDLKAKKLVFGAAGLPVEFRAGEEQFAAHLKELPAAAKALQRAGVTRVGTWIMPNHDELTYFQNLRRHARRLREVARVLADYGQRLGLEYVGPKTMWTAKRYPFVHSMAEMKDLIGEIGTTNVGFVLDSWHWYTAGESEADLLTLRNEEVVSVDLNDAPAGIPVDQQIDNRRELPMATGVIDVKTFLGALVKIGYDGPVRPEPFNAELRSLPPEQALAKTTAAMRKAFALVG